MSLTSALSDWLAAQGIWCPEGDGDTLRTAAAAWTAMGTVITDISGTLSAAATTLGDTTTGAGTSAFASYWAGWSGDTGYLTVSAAYCASLAAALAGFATDVDVASSAVVEGIEWAITQSNLAGLGAPFAPGAIPDAVPAGITPLAIDELRAAINQFAAALGAAATAQAASAGVTAIDPLAPLATPGAPVTSTTVTTTTGDAVITPLAAAPDLGQLATTVVDFGAGQGTVLAPDGEPVALPALAPLATPPTQAFDPSSVMPVDAVSTSIPTAVLPAAAAMSMTKPAALLAFGVGKAVRAGASALPKTSTSSAGFGGGGSLPSYSAGSLPKIPLSKIATGAPITVPPPADATLAAETAKGGAKGGAKVAANVGKSSGSMPFMPMGMGGAGAGGGGEEPEEARRRKRR